MTDDSNRNEAQQEDRQGVDIDEIAAELDHVRIEVEDGIAVVTLDKPDALNALSAEMLFELGVAFELVESDASARAMVVTGEGRAFAAGADVGALSELNDSFSGRETALNGQDVMNTLAAMPIPTIAAINGFALGGGLELALAADLRVAAKGAKLGLPEVGLGLIPGFGGSQRLPRLVGLGRALDMILTGRHVDADEALALGMVDRVSDDALATARELAAVIIKNAPIALGLAKEAVVRGLDMTLNQGLEVEADLFGLAASTDDSTEGTRAFLEKRAAEFSGR